MSRTYPILVFAITLGITAFFTFKVVDFKTGKLNLTIDSSAHRMMVKGDPNLKNIPVVMLTAEAGRENVMRIAKIGIRDYI